MISRADLVKIHLAKKQLGLDDDTYRAMLYSVAGVQSSKDLSVDGVKDVLRHMERSGFKPTRHKRPKVAGNRAAQIRKIEALLTDAGRPWAYLDGMIKRICSVDKIEFCDGPMLGKLIAALEYDAKRRRKPT